MLLLSTELKMRNNSYNERNSFFKLKKTYILLNLCSFNVKYVFNLHKSPLFKVSIVVSNVQFFTSTKCKCHACDKLLVVTSFTK